LPDEYLLENIKRDNEIQTDFFVPFTILRLTENMASETEYADCPVTLKNTERSGTRQRILHLYWKSEAITPDSIPSGKLGHSSPHEG